MKLADRMSRIGTESAFDVLARARALEAQGRDIVHLQIGEPDFDTPAHVTEAGHAGAARRLHPLRARARACPSCGTPSPSTSRQRAASRSSADNVCVAPGGKPIMFWRSWRSARRATR